MKIAFDFHGVLQEYPDKLKAMLRPLRIDHTIIVLSGPPLDQIYKELKQSGYLQGYHYDYAISVVDWLVDQGVEMKIHADGSLYCEEHLWWKSKARICKDENIEVLCDDSLKYKEHIINNTPLFLHIQ